LGGRYSILAIPTGGFWLSARKSFQSFTTLYRMDDFGNIIDELTLNGYAEKLTSINGQEFVGVGGKDNDLWIAKLDLNGGIQWEQQYGGTGIEIGHHVSMILGGGFYVVGSTLSSDGDVCLTRGEGDHWVLQLDDAGDLLWQKTYGGSGWDLASGGIVTCPDGFIVVGETTSNDWDAADIPDHQIFYSPLWIFRCNNLRYENLDIVQTDTSVCLNDPISLNVGPLNCIGQLQWNTGETDSEIQPDTQGIYWVENLYGSCAARDSVHIRFLPCNGESCILFPNAFTPNDDGYNDFFEPIIQCGDVAEIKIWVYNRWGQLVYKHEGLGTAGWDGKISNGESQPSDLYVWRCSYQNLIDGQLISEIMSGDITLIR
jgi:gliding motility-associated-like protein